MKEKLCVIYVTVPNKNLGLKIARELVSKKLSACVNIYGGVTSVYRYNGKIQEDNELVIFIKTRKSLFKKIEKEIKNFHTYECPCIIELPVGGSYGPFKKWVENETKS
ncbi:Divalent ion tolerance protein, CutA1 [Candidatus Omnitrophus magneticus]|uniref:Divalent ion tolerance protein, CutA1 n=1 Tax=Candidatus Omnitrophus magneticus TaxID=1609969 RepID=A0A0F0CP44_9BACT|nr:Divalent ion tolerance protein, CutA1 [Candidatus Omnitrophus magneticus]